MQNRLIDDWDGIEKLWNHTFSDVLQKNPAEHMVLLSERACNTGSAREKTAQIMFETFHVPAMLLIEQPLLAALASNRKTAVILDSGESVTSVVCVHNGRVVANSMVQQDVGGSHLTEFLWNWFNEKRGYGFSTTNEHVLVESYKEHCSVVLDHAALMRLASFWHTDPHKVNYFRQSCNLDQTLLTTLPLELRMEVFRFAATRLIPYVTQPDLYFELPSEHWVCLGKERFTCPETLFQPQLLGIAEANGLSQLVLKSIKQCDSAIWTELCSNVVLCGGNTMFPGLSERLATELSFLAPAQCPMHVIAPLERSNLVWIGGSKMAATPALMGPAAISKAEYDEAGPSIVNCK